MARIKKTNRNEIKETAMDAFIRNMESIRENLKKLNELANDNLYFNPDNINWGHVGSASYMNQELMDLADCMLGEGGYSGYNKSRELTGTACKK
jgi:hypothetical protein